MKTSFKRYVVQVIAYQVQTISECHIASLHHFTAELSHVKTSLCATSTYQVKTKHSRQNLAIIHRIKFLLKKSICA